MKTVLVSMLAGIGLFTLMIFFSMFFLMMSATKELKSGLSSISVGTLRDAPDAKANIGVVNVESVIMESSTIMDRIKELEEADHIKGIVVNINSPGGAVAPSQRIYEALLRLRSKKTVVASMETLAASGGYYVAASAERIFSYSGTLTGSIGVIMEFANLERLFGWMKVEPYVIKSGKFKDIGSPHRKMTPEEQEYMAKLISNVKDQFVRDIARGRKMEVEKILPVADGRVFTGEQAKELGLVDEIGSQYDAIQYVAKKNNIKPEDVIVDDGVDRKKKFFEDIFGGATSFITKAMLPKDTLMLVGGI